MDHLFQVHKELTTQALALVPFLISLAVGGFYVHGHLTHVREHAGHMITTYYSQWWVIVAFGFLFGSAASLSSSLLFLETHHLWQTEHKSPERKKFIQNTEDSLQAKALLLRMSIVLAVTAGFLIGGAGVELLTR